MLVYMQLAEDIARCFQLTEGEVFMQTFKQTLYVWTYYPLDQLWCLCYLTNYFTLTLTAQGTFYPSPNYLGKKNKWNSFQKLHKKVTWVFHRVCYFMAALQLKWHYFNGWVRPCGTLSSCCILLLGSFLVKSVYLVSPLLHCSVLAFVIGNYFQYLTVSSYFDV